MAALVARKFAAAGPLITRAVMVLALSLALALSARIQVPFWPVPMTLQTLAVLLIAGFAGPRIAVATMLTYLAEGVAGLPVFAGLHAGLPYLLGPTGGYLIGMLAAAALVGEGTRRAHGRPLALGVVMLLGTAVIYVIGAAWLAGFVGGAARAIEVGVLPFLVGDAVKATLAVALVLALRPRRA